MSRSLLAGAANSSAHSVTTGQCRHCDAFAAARSLCRLQHQGSVFCAAYCCQGGAGRGNKPSATSNHGPHRHTVLGEQILGETDRDLYIVP